MSILNTVSNALKLGVWLQRLVYYNPVILCNLRVLNFGFFFMLFPLPRILGLLSPSICTLRKCEGHPQLSLTFLSSELPWHVSRTSINVKLCRLWGRWILSFIPFSPYCLSLGLVLDKYLLKQRLNKWRHEWINQWANKKGVWCDRKGTNFGDRLVFDLH